jgi:signal transduction histidine kinase
MLLGILGSTSGFLIANFQHIIPKQLTKGNDFFNYIIFFINYIKQIQSQVLFFVKNCYFSYKIVHGKLTINNKLFSTVGVFGFVYYLISLLYISINIRTNHYAILINLYSIALLLSFLQIFYEYVFQKKLAEYLISYIFYTMFYCLSFTSFLILFIESNVSFIIFNSILCIMLLSLLVNLQNYIFLIILGMFTSAITYVAYSKFVFNGMLLLKTAILQVPFFYVTCCIFVMIILKSKYELKLNKIKLFNEAIVHEISTPLATLNVAVNILNKTNFDKKIIDIIIKNLKKSQQIVNNIVYNMEDEVQIDIEKIYVEDLFHKCTKDLPLTLRNFKLVSIEVKNNFIIEVDILLLEQVLINLIKNALHFIKNKNNGFVKITAFTEDNRNYISVYDNGDGIEPQNLPKIFESFYTTRKNGHGIGLSLSKKILEYMRAEISCESIRGLYTSFTLEFY